MKAQPHGALVKFLERHPFSSLHLLEEVFGNGTLQYLLEEADGQLMRIHMSDMGDLLAHKEEPKCSILGQRRYAVARRFALDVMGKEALLFGMSPGFEADGEFPWAKTWMRVWVDLGGCAVEALGFIRNPPREFGGDVRDVILTIQRERMETLAAQIGMNWGGGQEVFIWLFESNEYRKARTQRRASTTKRWRPYGTRDIETQIRTRRRGDARRSLLGALSTRLTTMDWDLLNLIGNMPLMTNYEAAYIVSDQKRKMEHIVERIQHLEGMDLIQTAKTEHIRDQLQDRKILAPLALEMLVGYWGTTIEIMHKFHPWPQKKERPSRERWEFSTDWLSRLRDHQQLVNQFVLALLYGARCVSNAIGGATVEIGTTIGSRILYRGNVGKGGQTTKILAPDALVDVNLWRRGWLDGATTKHALPVVRRGLLIELDKGTIGLTEIGRRIQKYGEVWKSLRGRRPALVWVIHGSPYRESRIMEMMRESEIEGWTVTMERLLLPEDDPWWVIHSPAKLNSSDVSMGLSYKAIGGMAPWRGIWQFTLERGMQPFTGVETWEGREGSKGRLRGEKREWMRYTHKQAVTTTGGK